MSISVEAHFAQQLASNLPKFREKALKKIGIWFQKVSVTSTALDEEILLRIWKGLYYYFWHCDKMLVQEEKADVISQYIHVFKSVKYSFLYLDTFLKTIAREWHDIDKFRLDKFLMLVRRFLHQGYQLLKNLKWEVKYIKAFVKTLKNTVLSPSSESVPLGLKIHISEIYMEELAKVGADEVTSKILLQFLLPYCRVLCYCDDPSLLNSVSKDVFLYLINQDADEDEFEELPVLQFKPTAVQKLLMKFANIPNIRRSNLKVIHTIIKEFENYKNGVNKYEQFMAKQYPNCDLKKRDIEKAALDLFKEETKGVKKMKGII
ncbi:ribosomal RNA processing protein 1 homolog A [Nephila pilipes]|uniref:Ribosomal RNA processing protein 1 homolog A n=1 Tax=Nephila pilipes TaxID=299642 RepID=A0A8X6P3P9_NEPPI|nr:ribosomal RNA processing protein 1 homolog A [Nephila pilipes]